MFVMKNGCLCCTGAADGEDDLERILDRLLKIVDRDGYDYVMVETTGNVQEFLSCDGACTKCGMFSRLG